MWVSPGVRRHRRRFNTLAFSCHSLHHQTCCWFITTHYIFRYTKRLNHTRLNHTRLNQGHCDYPSHKRINQSINQSINFVSHRHSMSRCSFPHVKLMPPIVRESCSRVYRCSHLSLSSSRFRLFFSSANLRVRQGKRALKIPYSCCTSKYCSVAIKAIDLSTTLKREGGNGQMVFNTIK